MHGSSDRRRRLAGSRRRRCRGCTGAIRRRGVGRRGRRAFPAHERVASMARALFVRTGQRCLSSEAAVDASGSSDILVDRGRRVAGGTPRRVRGDARDPASLWRRRAPRSRVRAIRIGPGATLEGAVGEGFLVELEHLDAVPEPVPVGVVGVDGPSGGVEGALRADGRPEDLARLGAVECDEARAGDLGDGDDLAPALVEDHGRPVGGSTGPGRSAARVGGPKESSATARRASRDGHVVGLAQWLRRAVTQCTSE